MCEHCQICLYHDDQPKASKFKLMLFCFFYRVSQTAAQGKAGGFGFAQKRVQTAKDDSRLRFSYVITPSTTASPFDLFSVQIRISQHARNNRSLPIKQYFRVDGPGRLHLSCLSWYTANNFTEYMKKSSYRALRELA